MEFNSSIGPPRIQLKVVNFKQGIDKPPRLNRLKSKTGIWPMTMVCVCLNKGYPNTKWLTMVTGIPTFDWGAGHFEHWVGESAPFQYRFFCGLTVWFLASHLEAEEGSAVLISRNRWLYHQFLKHKPIVFMIMIMLHPLSGLGFFFCFCAFPLAKSEIITCLTVFNMFPTFWT